MSITNETINKFVVCNTLSKAKNDDNNKPSKILNDDNNKAPKIISEDIKIVVNIDNKEITISTENICKQKDICNGNTKSLLTEESKKKILEEYINDINEKNKNNMPIDDNKKKINVEPTRIVGRSKKKILKNKTYY